MNGQPPAKPLGGRWSPTHQHRKGGLYRVVGSAVWEPDRSPVVIYDDADGHVWVRPEAEFDDGRFTPLSLPDTKPAPKAGFFGRILGTQGPGNS